MPVHRRPSRQPGAKGVDIAAVANPLPTTYHFDSSIMITAELRDWLRVAAAENRILITLHAQQRMLERNISRIMIKKCLLLGTLIEGPSFDSAHNSDICKLGYYMAGCNYQVVAARSRDDPYAIVVTVINKETGHV